MEGTRMTKEEIIKQYNKEKMSQLGKQSARSPLRTKEYYAQLGRKSAASKKAKKEKERKEVNSVTNIGYNLLTTGKI